MEKFYRKDGKLFFYFKRGLFELDDVASEAHKREYPKAFERFEASEKATTEEVKVAVIEAAKPSAIEKLTNKIVLAVNKPAKKGK